MIPHSVSTVSLQPITATSELADACRRMAKHPFVTIDTEFLRETTYYPLLCVAQMASAEEAVVIDALAPGINLAPFYELMADEKAMKVFHAARQDIEIVWHAAKLIPHPIFDTQVAAMVLGYGDSISYDQLVQRITAIRLTSRIASLTGRGGRSRKRSCATRFPTSRICVKSISSSLRICASAAAPNGSRTKCAS